MSENFDDPHPHPDPNDPHPAPPEGAGGDLPADFFNDDLSAPAPAPAPPRFSDAPSPPAYAEEWARPAAEPAPTPTPRPKGPAIPILMGGLFAAALATAAAYERRQNPKTGAPEPAVAIAPSSAPSAAFAESLTGVRDDIERLSAQLEALQGEVDAIPKSATGADLKPVQARLDELAKAAEVVQPLPEKLGKLDERVGGLDDALKGVRGEVAELKTEVAKAGEAAKSAASAPRAAAPGASESAPAPAPAADADGTALARGADQFKAGRYREAADAFRKLAASEPQDARVYYYAALANGAATNNWRGETERLVTRGVELERAGTPRASEIDSTFAGLPASMKGWLDTYRRRAR
jgi:TolA-binding protein